MTKQPTDIIGYYAKLQILAERYAAAGQYPPTNITRKLQEIETRARATLSPVQLRAAEHHAHVAKDRILREIAATQRSRTAADTQQYVEDGVRKMTRGMAGSTEGLTEEQFRAVLDGKPIPGRRAPNQDERDAVFRQQTASFDPRGQGWTEREWVDRLDQLADANDRQFDSLSKNYRAESAALRKTADTWRTDRVGYELQRRRSEGEAPSRELTANDDDRRRADVIAAYADYAYEEKRPEMMDDDPIPQTMMEDEGRTGDIARAWTEVDARGDSDG